jgi:hypothetical protein
MKKIKLIFTTMILALIAVSCENDGGSSKLDLIEGAVPNIRKIATSDQGLNLVALQSGDDIDLGLTFDQAFGELSSLDVVAYYTKNGVTERAVLKTNVTTFPSTINFNQNDLINAFTALNTAADFGLTDRLLITADLTLKNGSLVRLYDEKGVALYGTDIANTTDFAVFQSYVALCPLDDTSLFTGDFEVVEDGWADYAPGDILTLVHNPADGAFTFRIPNLEAGNSPAAYYIVTVNPVDNSVTVNGNELFDYGVDILGRGNGSVASCSGEINLKIGYFTPDGSGTYGTYDLKLAKVN